MSLSYSRVETFVQCPYKYFLKYHEEMKTIPKYEPDDALILGTAFHMCIEESVDKAVEWYKSQFPIITDAHEDEALKLERIGSLARKKFYDFANGRVMLFERGIYDYNLDWVGYVDCLIQDGEDWILADFKYASSPARYRESSQIQVYKHFVENNLNVRISDAFYLVAPKIRAKKKFEDTQEDFRVFLNKEIENYSESEIEFVRPDSDNEQENVATFYMNCGRLRVSREFPKKESPLCRFCEYTRYCNSNGKDLTEITL